MSQNPYKSDLVDLSVVIVHETERAILVDHGGTSNVWLPKSWVEIEKNSDGKTHTITLRESQAMEKGLI